MEEFSKKLILFHLKDLLIHLTSYLPNSKGKNSNLTVRKHSRHHSNQVTKINISQNRTKQCHVPLDVIYQERTHHFCGICGKNALPEYNHEETSVKFQLRDILHNNWPVLKKKKAKAKDKERLRKCSD